MTCCSTSCTGAVSFLSLALLLFLQPESDQLTHLDLGWIAWEGGTRFHSGAVQLDGHRLHACYPKQDRSRLPRAFPGNQRCQVLKLCLRELVDPGSSPRDLQGETSLLASLTRPLHHGYLDPACQHVASSPLPERLLCDDPGHEIMERLDAVGQT